MQLLGEGAFGKVMKVQCNIDGKYYAIKTINKIKAITAKVLSSVQTEIKILSKISHPNIIKFLG